MKSVLFVCLGNICRSPLAEGIFAHLLQATGRTGSITHDSAGNGSWHEGDSPDERAIATAARHGIDISNQQSRSINVADFDRFDLILCMDRGNIDRLKMVQPTANKAEVALFLKYTTGQEDDVPDPYYGGSEGFEAIFRQIYNANQKLLEKLA